ncbi:deoxyribonuclease IV [Sporanaerobium hydrogeniformans]|uniref:Deoxyribonuclease IV n=1 Tax=Sporanaerobium hydrogeniformans TaxID=3072179 RepID=A0AC61DEM3_9FIRM|nr:deoxyribonuclease IV [Sporanaerobium hydrogeniformans]PHV71288.1 deoxyribonuclease IV [Sporanaerobium hydrogeniformans]
MFKIGSHVSISGGLLGAAKEAYSYGANTFMIYTGAPQNTKRSPLEKLKIKEGQAFMAAHDLSDIVVHAPYIINLASPKEETYALAKEFLALELERTEAIGSNYLVLHPGSFTTQTYAYGIERIAAALNEVLTPTQKPILCLETMAGKGSEIGRSFEELRDILDRVEYKDKLGICFDTCHLHDSGYNIINDFDKLLEYFDALIGLDKLKVVHLNGSLNVCGAKKDRHANLGADETNPRGADQIGKEALYAIAHHPALEGKPIILETPWLDAKTNLYKEEIAFLREGLK